MELEISRSIEDSSKVFSFISQQKHVSTPQNRLSKIVLMKGHKICFCGENEKLSMSPFLLRALVKIVSSISLCKGKNMIKNQIRGVKAIIWRKIAKLLKKAHTKT